MATTYTHNFNFTFDGTTLQGELCFNAQPHNEFYWKTNTPVELTSTELEELSSLLNDLRNLYGTYGGGTFSITVTPKV